MKKLLFLFSNVILAQTFGTISVVDISQHTARVQSTISQDGWVQILLGLAPGGPYTTFKSSTHCTNSPEIVFSGGTPTSPASAYIFQLSATGQPSLPQIVYTGNYASAPTATIVDRCLPSYKILTATWSGGTITFTTDPTYDGSSNFVINEPVTITNSTNALYNGSYTVASASGNTFTVALVSNPGVYLSNGVINAVAGSGATVGVTFSGTSVTGLTITGGTWYHGQAYGGFAQNITGAPGTKNIYIGFAGLSDDNLSHTYYGIIQYRTGMNDTSTITATSSEFNFTTSTPCSGPCLPTLPQITFDPASSTNHPSFVCGSGGYTCIPIAFNSGLGECAATSTIGPIAYGGVTPGPTTNWQVLINDTIQQILNKVGYGAILEIAEGSQCLIPTSASVCPSGSANHPGSYVLCTLSKDPLATNIDDPISRYIVIRPHVTNITNFPPFGVMIDNSTNWSASLPYFVSQAAQTGQPAEGFQVDSENNFTQPVHHYWIERIGFTANSTGTHTASLNFGQNNGSLSSVYPPKYMVLNQIVINAPTRVANTTTTYAGITGTPGGYFSLTDSWISGIDTNFETAQGVYFGDCGTGPLTVKNNFINAIGEPFYLESTGFVYCNNSPPVSVTTQINSRSYDDVTFQMMKIYNPLSTLQGNIAWDGLNRTGVRNDYEAKIGRRHLLKGNFFNGQWSQQTVGEFIAMTPTFQATVGPTGSMDWTVDSNYLINGAIAMSFGAQRSLGSGGGAPQPSATTRLYFHNNFLSVLGKNMFGSLAGSGLGPGLGPAYFIGGASDVTIDHNTLPTTNGDVGSNGLNGYQTWFSMTNGSPLGTGLTVTKNTLSLDGGGVSPSGIFSSYDPGCCSNFIPYPLFDQSTIASQFNTAFPNKTWNSNTIIPGWYGNASTPWTQTTDSQATTLETSNPAGDTLITASGCTSSNCLSQHLTNAGLTGLNTYNGDCTVTSQNDCTAGADIPTLENNLGIVRNITAKATAGSTLFSYTAPDSQSCSIDTSPTGTTGTWTRTTDPGGVVTRTISINGTTLGYHYRLMCYALQDYVWFNFSSDSSNLTTQNIVTVMGVGGNGVTGAGLSNGIR